MLVSSVSWRLNRHSINVCCVLNEVMFTGSKECTIYFQQHSVVSATTGMHSTFEGERGMCVHVEV